MRARKSHPSPAQVFGERVREARLRREWSQGALADRLHIDRTTLNKIERGVRGDVSISQLFTFAAILHISPTHLLTPRSTDDKVQMYAGTAGLMSAAEARRWIRGLPPSDATTTELLEWFLDLPRDEQRMYLEKYLSDGLNPLEAAATAETRAGRIDAVMAGLEEREEDHDG